MGSTEGHDPFVQQRMGSPCSFPSSLAPPFRLPLSVWMRSRAGVGTGAWAERAQGGEYTVEGVMDAGQDAQLVYDLLADYDRVAAVFSNVLESTTHAAAGAGTTLQQARRLGPPLTRARAAGRPLIETWRWWLYSRTCCSAGHTRRYCRVNNIELLLRVRGRSPSAAPPCCSAGSSAVAEPRRGAAQVCRWEFLMFSGKFEMALTVSEQSSDRVVTFSLVSSPFMRTFQGRWQARLSAPQQILTAACRHPILRLLGLATGKGLVISDMSQPPGMLSLSAWGLPGAQVLFDTTYFYSLGACTPPRDRAFPTSQYH